MLNSVSLTHPSLQILDKTQTRVFSISRFLVEFLIKKYCHNSRTSNDIDIKLRAVTKLDKRNAATSKKYGHDLDSVNYDFIVIFPIFARFGAIR